MRNYYLLEVWRDVEPILHGQFPTEQERDPCYVRLQAADPGQRNGLYCLTSTGQVELG